MNYSIFENLVPESYSTDLLQKFEHVQWQWTPSSSDVGTNFDKNDKKIRDSSQFVHAISGYNAPMSPLYEAVIPIVWFFEKETGVRVKNVIRIKANCLSRDGDDEDKYNPPHVDVYDPGFYSMVYYLEDSDGDTLIFNKFIQEGFENLTIQGRVSPKKGSAVMFPSHLLHASSCPVVNKRRMVINFILELDQ